MSTDLTGERWASAGLSLSPRAFSPPGTNSKMADPVEGVRNLVAREIESICCSLKNPTAVVDVQEALESIGQIVYGVNCLDSVTRLPDDVYRDISSAKRIDH